MTVPGSPAPARGNPTDRDAGNPDDAPATAPRNGPGGHHPAAPTTEPHPSAQTNPTGSATFSVRRIRLVGLVGSLLLALGSLGAGALPVYDPVARVPVLGALRRGTGPDVALACVYAGLAVLAMAWLYLGREVRRNTPGTGPGDLLRVAALWAAPLLLAAPLFSRDMYSYAAQAQLTHHGLDPYSNGPAALPGPFLDEVQRMWVDTPAPYGPLWLILGALVAGVVGQHVLLTVFTMRLLAVAGTVLIAVFMPRLARHFGVNPSVALWLALLNPLVLIHFVGGGHNDALMLGLVVAGLWLALTATTERRLVGAVVVVTLAVLVKAPAAFAVAFLAPIWAVRTNHNLAGRTVGRHRRWLWPTAKVAVVSLGTFAVVTLASGLGTGWTRQLSTPGAVVNWLSVPTGLGMLANGVRHIFGPVEDGQALIDSLRLVGKVLSLAAAAAIWGWSWRGRPVRWLAVTLTIVVMFAPVVQPWYLLWPLVLAAVTPLPDRVRTVAAGVCVFLSLLITPQGATLFNMAAPVVTTGLAVIVATYVTLAREPQVDPLPAPAGTALEQR